jgi:alpha-L-rhamnosidase
VLSRRRKLLCIALTGLLGLSFAPASQAAMTQASDVQPAYGGPPGKSGDVLVADLQVENATEPLGLDVERPRLSWRLDTARPGVAQTAYQIQVATSHTNLRSRPGNPDVWDSGQVSSASSAQIVYEGPALESATRYYSRVRVWDETGTASAWSPVSWWETGLFDEADWDASEWITHSFERELPAYGDMTLELEFTVLNNAAGVFFRADDAGNGYMWQLSTTSGEPILRPHVRVNGGYTLLGEVPLGDVVEGGLDEPHTLTIVAEGDQLTTLIDGIEVDVRSDDRHASGTVGFRTSGQERGRFDNVTVTMAGEVAFSEDFSDSNPFSAGSIVDGALEVTGGSDALLVPPHPSAPRLRHEFTLDDPVAQARLYLSGLGYSVTHLNGERVGDSVLDPGHTDFSDTVHYVVSDVTDLVKRGENAIGVELGRGFYGVMTGNAWNWRDAPWFSDPELRAMLVVTHRDGSTTVVGSDDSWMTSEDGPTRYDEVFVGETYDARREQPGWSSAGFDAANWAPAQVVDGPTGTLRAQKHEPIRVTETVEPVEITEPQPGVYVFDLGVQIAGWAQLTVEGEAGSEVSLHYGERLDGNGLVTIPQYGNFHSVPRQQTDLYTLAGDGAEVWEPSYTYKGFRYIEVRGLSSAPTTETVVGRRVHNDFASIGHFESGSALLNKIRDNTRRALLNNHHHVPTDTPVYEKAGWTGDARLTASTIAYEFDMTRFHTKYLADFIDAQRENGELPTIVPTSNWSYEDAPGWPAVHGPTPAWDAALFEIAWNLYLTEGDVRVLEEHYDGMREYFTWLESYASDDGLFRVGLGDWVAPGGNPPEGPVLSSTAHAYLFASRLADIAELLGDDERVSTYRDRAAELYQTFNDAFLDEDAGLYRTPGVEVYRQTSNALPLAFGLVPDEHVEDVVANLVADVEARGTHLNTGVVGTRYLLPVLTAHGEIDTAYAVATQTTEPSWGYWIETLGRTSLQEHWQENTRSLNHHFFGSIGHWLFADLAGITPGEPGWAVTRVKPHIPADLDSAEASTKTVRGTVAASWQKTESGLQLRVTVPANSTGEIHVPLLGHIATDVVAPDAATFVGEDDGYAVFRVGSGDWQFAVSD